MSEGGRRGPPPTSVAPPLPVLATAALVHPHLLWGKGFIPQLTDVHAEYMSLTGRDGAGMTEAEVLAGLTAKRDAIDGYVTMASEEAGTAFSEAAAILDTM